MTRAPVHLSDIQYRRGAPYPVADLVGRGIAALDAQRLLDNGVLAVATLEVPLAQSIADCVGAVLNGSGTRPQDIDDVIIATESFDALGDEVQQDRGDPFGLARDVTVAVIRNLGLGRAALLYASYAGCLNFVQALLMAEAIVAQASERKVLIIAAERLTGTGSRLMRDAVSLIGDGAAALLVSNGAQASGGFVLDHVTTAAYRQSGAGVDVARLMLEMCRGMKTAAVACCRSINREPDDFRWLVLGDYNRETSWAYGKVLGFHAGKIFMPHVGQYGHIPFDPLINLADLARTSSIAPDENVFMLACGPMSCACIALTAR